MKKDTTKCTDRQKETLSDIARQLEMALGSDKTPEGVKDCLKTIIFEASNEAGLPLADCSLIRSAFPNIIEALPKDYGRGIYHSLHAILTHDTAAFRDFYEQRLDEKPEKQNEAEVSKEWDLAIADELAEFIGDGIYPMDVWQFVVDTLETMAKRNGLGFNDYDYVKAVTPILLERCEDNREGIICMLEAVKRAKTFRAKLQTEGKKTK